MTIKDHFNDMETPVSIKKIGPVTKIHQDRNLAKKNNSNDYTELIIIIGGTGIICIETIDFSMGIGDIFLIKNQQQHYFKKKEGLAFYSIKYQPEKLPFPIAELKKIPGYHAIFHLEPYSRKHRKFESHLHLKRSQISKLESILRTMTNEIEYRPTGFEASLISCLLQLIIEISKKYTEKPQTTESRSILRVAEIIRTLEKEYSKPWKTSEMANMIQISEGNFLRIFKEATGKDPIDYLMDIRIKQAMEFLNDLSLSVTDIAYKTGFNDSNYFTRIFRKIVGVTPTKYRKQSSSSAIRS